MTIPQTSGITLFPVSLASIDPGMDPGVLSKRPGGLSYYGIESLTMPPEGDLSYAQARKQWPEKLLWCNINVSNYNLPPAALRTLVRERVGKAAPDGRLCAFEISEDRPGNWKRTIKVVLDELGG